MIFDIITTHYAINSFGLSEGNPIMAMVTSSILLFVLVKAFGTALIIGIYRQIENRNKQIANIGKTVIVSMMLMVVVFNSIQIVSAESGTIEIVDFYDGSPYLPNPDGASASPVYTRVVYAPSIVNYIDNFRFKINSASPNNFESTQFTSSQGCSGHAWYDINSSGAYIVYSSRCYVDSSGYDTLTYSKNIFSNITIQGGSANYFNTAVGQPVGIGTVVGLTVGQRAQYEDVNAGVVAYDSYTVTYPMSGYFNTTVIKNPSVDTKYKIERGDRSVYTIENAYTDVSFSSMNQQSAGIYLNATLPTGAYTRVLVNSSGCGVVCEEQESQTYPDDGANVYFDETSYTRGDNIGVTWFVSNSTYNAAFTTCDFQWWKDGAKISTFENILQVDSTIFPNVESGSYEGRVVCGVFGDALEGYAQTTVVNEGITTITMNATQISKVPFNATVSLGYTTPASKYGSTGNGLIELIVYSSTGQIMEGNPNVINLGTIGLRMQASTTYPPGSYTAKVYDYVKDRVVASKGFTVVSYPDRIPTIGLSNHSLTMPASTFFLNEWTSYTYTVNDSMWRNYSVYVESINRDTNQITFRRGIEDQLGTSELYLQEQSDTQCVSRFCYFVAGNNTLRTVAYNTTSGYTSILAQANFTITSVTAEGWGLKLSSDNVSVGQELTITLTSPSSGRAQIRDPGYGTNGTVVFSASQGTGTGKYKTAIKRVGFYDVVALDSSGNVKVRLPLKVGSSAAIVTPTPNRAGDDGIDPMDALDSYVLWLGMGFNETAKLAFAIIVITVMGVVALWMSGGRGDIASIVVFAPYAFMTYIGYIPKWIFVIVVILTALALKIFR